ncbi:MAG TPA: glycosyltransferase family 9 protein [Acetobacteraceae bacterium]|nr:glycosyltransferase family 9 protein [Acetobacteraceae bacterium]
MPTQDAESFAAASRADDAEDSDAEAELAPDAAAAPQILIQIDPEVSGGFIHGRFDVQIRGRVTSPAVIEDVELETDGVVVARTVFGQPHRAPVATMPDGTPGRHRAFQFSMPRLQARAAALCRCLIRARTSDGHSHTEALDLEIDPAASQPVIVRSGPTLTGLADTGGRPQIVLYVEHAALDGDGNLDVVGWAVAMTAIVTVQVFAGEHDRLPAAKLGGQRDDVANFYPTYPNARLSGFALSAHVDLSAWSLGSVRVQALSMHGFAIEVVVPVGVIAARGPARPAGTADGQPPDPAQSFSRMHAAPADDHLTADLSVAADPLLQWPTLNSMATPGGPDGSELPPAVDAPEPAAAEPRAVWDKRREIHYYCDQAVFAPDGTVGVDGWAVCAVGIAGVSVYLGGEKLGDAELGWPRPDVGDEHAAIPMARLSGFRFHKHLADIADGEHAVRVVVRNGLDDLRDEVKLVAFRRAAAPPPAEAPPPAAEPQVGSEFRFELDAPQVVDDAVQEPVTGRLTIEGWVLAHSGIAALEVFLDDQRLGEAHYGLARQDVGAAFPDWENALRSGYAFHCPPRSLRDGTHTVRLAIRSNNGQEMIRSFTIEVKKTEDDDSIASIRRRMGKAEANILAEVLRDLEYHPGFRLILRQTGAPAPGPLRATIESLARQGYADWRLAVLTDADDGAAALRALVADCAGEHAERITVTGPSDAAFDALLGAGAEAAGAGEGGLLFGLLCPGDELGVDALAEIALAGGLHRAADFLYADESRVNPASREREPFFKPDFSPDLLLSTNYIGRPWFAAASLLRRVAVTPRALLRNGEYDLVLRCTEQAAAVHHVPKLLAQRGAEWLDGDATSRAALARAAMRAGIDAEVMDGCLPGTWRFRRVTPATGKVAIIIPTCAAHGYIETCIATLRDRTTYRNYEIVCIDNIPNSQVAWKIWLQQNADRIVDIPEPFNWSRFNNLAAAATDSEYLLFLNDDIEITQDDWLDVLLEHMQRPEVGIVGPQLRYPSGKVQHAGMFLGAGIGRHAFRFAPADDPGYFGLALTQRNVIAVTGACMLMRRDFFEQIGRFDEAHSVINNDLDFCLRAHRAGKLTVFTPHASLIHHELASRERLGDVFDTTHFNSRWKTLFAAGDPYFSPLLSRFSDDYRPDDEAAQTVFAAHPLFEADEIRRILVVKLDHIGDFVTGLPAIRRLKAMFPRATISVLAGRHARGFASMEPAIDEFLEFEFFHARSQLGERELTKEDFLELRARLAPYRFDLAVDLRKHLSTRDVLQYTGARFLAGYDYMGQFPFLDVALEWEGDKTLQRKRSHIVDDLLALVEAIGTACGTDRDLLPAAPARPDPETLPEAVRALFDKPVVAMHIGAGNITKTWPAGYFSALIDLLTERNGVNVMLIGGPDEREPSEALRQTLLRPDAVGSVAGETALSDLPRLLSACCLYIGNDSGPKHIAAALGIPTIGIHSGVVDAIEWGPVGRRAVALRRNMTCSPCYLARAEDCPRALACLRNLEPAVVYQTAAMLLARPVAWVGAERAEMPVDMPSRAEPAALPGAAGPAAKPVQRPDAAGLAARPEEATDEATVAPQEMGREAIKAPLEGMMATAMELDPTVSPVARLAGRAKVKPRVRRRRARA